MNLEALRRQRAELIDRERSLRVSVAQLEKDVQRASQDVEPLPVRLWLWWILWCFSGSLLMVEAIKDRL